MCRSLSLFVSSVAFTSFSCHFVLLFVTNVLKDSLNVSYCVRKVRQSWEVNCFVGAKFSPLISTFRCEFVSVNELKLCVVLLFK